MKRQDVLPAGAILDATVDNTDPDSEATAEAKTAGYNRADGASVFVAASAASAWGSWTGCFQAKILWTPSLPCSLVPVKEGTA